MHSGWPGCCGLVVREREANLGMVADLREPREIGGNPGRFFERALARFPSLKECVQGPPESIRTVGPLTWITRRQSVPGCLLLGDAAGFYDPFTGQGVTFALLTASLAARVADEALADGDVSGERLGEYQRGRRNLLGPKVRVQQAIQMVLERRPLRERVLDRLRRRPRTARELLGVVADVIPAARALTPGFLFQLLA
jgi:flavin-dependent dehydrogenase